MTCKICGASEYLITEYQDQITDEYVKLEPPEIIIAEQGDEQGAIDKYTELHSDRWAFHGAVYEEIENDPCINGSCGFDCHKEELK